MKKLLQQWKKLWRGQLQFGFAPVTPLRFKSQQPAVDIDMDMDKDMDADANADANADVSMNVDMDMRRCCHRCHQLRGFEAATAPSQPHLHRGLPLQLLLLLFLLLLRCGLDQNVPGAFQLMLRRLCNRVWHLALMARAYSKQSTRRRRSSSGQCRDETKQQPQLHGITYLRSTLKIFISPVENEIKEKSRK